MSKYTKLIEWSDEDNCFIGSCPELVGQCCHGDNEQDVYRQLCVIVDEWIAIKNPPLPEKKEYSGKFNIRLTPEQHQLVAIKAKQQNKSLNSYCADRLLRF